MLLRCEPPTKSPAQPMEENVSVKVIYDLLNSLVKPPLIVSENVTTNETEKPGPNQKTSNRRSSEILRTTPDPILTDPAPVPDELNIIGSKSTKETTSTSTKVSDDEAKKPMFMKHLIIKFLAEAVRSYGAIAKIIIEFTYKAGQSELVTEVFYLSYCYFLFKLDLT